MEGRVVHAPRAGAEEIEKVWMPIVEMITKYWDATGADLYGKPIEPEVVPLMNMWQHGTLVVFGAYDSDNTLQGIILGVQFHPLMYNALQLTIEIVHATSDEAYAALFDVLKTAKGIMGFTDVYVAKFVRDTRLLNILHERGVVPPTKDLNIDMIRIEV